MFTDGGNVYERKKLYQEVWSEPIRDVAKRYGVSDSTIHKTCKTLNIPKPPKGYWAKVKHGKKVKKEPLPKVKNGANYKFGKQPTNREEKPKEDNTLSFLSIEEQEKILSVVSSLKINPNKKLCREIQEYKKLVAEWNENNDSIEGKTCTNSDYQYHNKAPLLAGVISKTGLERSYRILDCLIDGLKQLGYSINNNMSFDIRGEYVDFDIYEAQDKTEHVLTNEEKKLLEEYERNKKRYHWETKPKIRKYDRHFDGRLTFRIDESKFMKDTSTSCLEERLSDIFILLIKKSEIVRNARLRREEERRKHDETEKLKEMFVEKYNNEVNNLTILFQEADDFERAVKIRNYVKYIEQNDYNHQNGEWISWAKHKADWYDPMKKINDSVFGIRDRESDAIPLKLQYLYT